MSTIGKRETVSHAFCSASAFSLPGLRQAGEAEILKEAGVVSEATARSE
ncbi:hypothetical protein BPNPMPFG_001519 [Mesorhizobium sp. AR07]|nr:hypothetical protein BPNPMPFG_001519 [Mesorhizobium sp. AR07]